MDAGGGGSASVAGADQGADQGSGGGGSDGRLLRQTTVSVARLQSRVTDLEEKITHTISTGGGGGRGSVRSRATPA